MLLQSSKKKHLAANLFMIFSVCSYFIFSGCIHQPTDNKISEEQKRIDTLWGIIKNTKDLYTYDMEEIAVRKVEMDSLLNILRLGNGNLLNKNEQADITSYYAVRRAYAPIANQYKMLVLETEDLFFRVKALEKSVKAGQFERKKEEFKKVYAELKFKLEKNFIEARNKLEVIKSLEPTYQRLSPKIEEYAERLLRR